MTNLAPPKTYRPRQIAELGLIRNSTGGNNVDSNYIFILREIKSGRLKARNYSKEGKLNYWLVSEKAIKDYHAKNQG